MNSATGLVTEILAFVEICYGKVLDRLIFEVQCFGSGLCRRSRIRIRIRTVLFVAPDLVFSLSNDRTVKIFTERPPKVTIKTFGSCLNSVFGILKICYHLPFPNDLQLKPRIQSRYQKRNRKFFFYNASLGLRRSKLVLIHVGHLCLCYVKKTTKHFHTLCRSIRLLQTLCTDVLLVPCSTQCWNFIIIYEG
jgi:hypothetical protein